MNELPNDTSSNQPTPPPLQRGDPDDQLQEQRPPIVAWRWWLHLIALAAYPPTIGLLSTLVRDRDSSPALSDNVTGLLLTVLQTYVLFCLFFVPAWLASRASKAELMLRWRRGWRPWAYGLSYALALQVIVRIVVVIILMAAVAYILLTQGGPFTTEAVNKEVQQIVQQYRPETEKLVDNNALVNNPLYLLATLTLVSFAMAGLTEELWRAGLFAGFAALFPRHFATLPGKAVIVMLVAVIFGLGHLPQGLGAVLLTGIIGLMLGSIMLFHRSTWVAVLTHGFFDAMSFLTLWYVQSHPEMLKSLEKVLQRTQ